MSNNLLIKLMKRIYHFLISDRVLYKKVILPAKYLRYCGNDFHDNEHYLNSALNEADRLLKTIKIDHHSSILDIGCGVGRLAIGLAIKCPSIRAYYGVDVSARAITWCKKYFFLSFQFQFHPD